MIGLMIIIGAILVGMLVGLASTVAQEGRHF